MWQQLIRIAFVLSPAGPNGTFLSIPELALPFLRTRVKQTPQKRQAHHHPVTLV
jgi:hypothetical protein